MRQRGIKQPTFVSRVLKALSSASDKFDGEKISSAVVERCEEAYVENINHCRASREREREQKKSISASSFWMAANVVALDARKCTVETRSASHVILRENPSRKFVKCAQESSSKR